MLDSRVVLSSVGLSRQFSQVDVDEGRHAHNFGYASSDVAITSVVASTGTIDFDAYWGLWQWNYDPADGPDDSQTVEVTATDADGAENTISFALNVLNLNPDLQLSSDQATTHRGITFQHGDISFADEVVSFTPGSNTAFTDATRTLGTPTGGDNSLGATLGNGGSITLQFTDNALVDQSYVANGADLYIYDLGIDEEEILLEISVDGTNWIAMPDPIALSAGKGTGIDISAIATAGTAYSFVRITDVYLAGEYDPYYVGPDIDAVGVIGAVNPVSINGGETATHSGSFADAGATDVVNITASIGTIIQSGTNNGAWNWSLPTTLTDDGTTVVTITATDSDGGVSVASFDLIVTGSEVDVDINITSGPINLNGLNGNSISSRFVSVAIFSTSLFRASDIDLSTLTFAGANLARAQWRDLDGDGDLDLVAYFQWRDTNLLQNLSTSIVGQSSVSTTLSVNAELTGLTQSGIAFRGDDTLQLVGDRNGGH